MPIYIRILILVGIYLIYLLAIFINYKDSIKNVNKKEKEKIKEKFLFSFIIKNVILLVLLFGTFTEYIFFSYNKLILISTYFLLLALEGLYSFFSKKEKVRLAIITIGICVSAPVIVFLSLSCSILNDSYIAHFLNPTEIANERYEEAKISDLTVNLYELEYKDEVKHSIGFRKEEGTYFFYYKDSKTRRNIEKEILPTEVISVTPVYNENTYIIAEETKYDIIFTERKPESKYYKKEVSETKYRMYINPEEYAQVDE